MKRIKIFLASSNELLGDRLEFEREIYRKCKIWFDQEIFLHLDIWEDLSARLSKTRSQDEYNKKIQEADLFVLLAYSKVGMYTAEEFREAYGIFKKTKKPFIFTYFKDIDKEKEDSLQDFKTELEKLEHFYASYTDFKDFWLQFNKELDRLLLEDFETFSHSQNEKGSFNVDNPGANIGNQFNGGTFNNPTFNN